MDKGNPDGHHRNLKNDMSQSAEYKVEQSLVQLFNSITGLNVYTTNTTGSRLFPSVVISSRAREQLVSPYSGVFDVFTEIQYSQTSARYTASEFDDEYLNVFGSLYSQSPELTAKMQDVSSGILFYMCRISEQTPTILDNKKAWKRTIGITSYVTPDENTVGLRDYEFDDFLNSFYLATI